MHKAGAREEALVREARAEVERCVEGDGGQEAGGEGLEGGEEVLGVERHFGRRKTAPGCAARTCRQGVRVRCFWHREGGAKGQGHPDAIRGSMLGLKRTAGVPVTTVTE